MPRRRTDNSWIQPITGVVSLMVFFCIIKPNFRNFFLVVGLWLLCVVTVVGIGLLTYKILKKKRSVPSHVPLAPTRYSSLSLTDLEKYGPKPTALDSEKYGSKPKP